MNISNINSSNNFTPPAGFLKPLENDRVTSAAKHALKKRKIEPLSCLLQNLLPDELLLRSIFFLSASDLCRLGVTCTKMYRLIRDFSLWHPLLEQDWRISLGRIQNMDSYRIYYNLQKGQSSQQTISLHRASIPHIAAHGNTLFSASFDGSVKMLDTTHREQSALTIITDFITLMNVYGSFLVLGSYTGSIYVWNIETQTLMHTFQDPNHTFLLLCIVEEDQLYVFSNHQVRVWNILTGALLDTFDNAMNNEWAHAAMSGGKMFLATKTGEFSVRDAKTFKEITYSFLENENVHLLPNNFKVSGSKILNTTIGGHLYITDLMLDTSHDRDIMISEPTSNGFYLEADDSTAFVGTENGLIKVIDLSTGACTHTLNEHTAAISALHMGKTRLFSASHDGTVKIWNTNNGTLLQTIHPLIGPLSALCFMNSKLVVGSFTGEIAILDFNF